MKKGVKNKMNKKNITLGFIGLLSIGLAVAMIVPYLSNTAEVEMNVESPMSVLFSDNGVQSDALDLGDTTGLSTVEFSVIVENLANNEIVAPTLKMIVDNDNHNSECADFTSIKFTDTWCHGDGLGVCPEQELAGVGLCDDTTGKAVYTIPTVKYKVGQLTEYPVSATFGNVLPDDYTITAEILA